MYQEIGSNGIAKQRVRHQSFYFIVRLFFKLSACPFVHSLMFFKDYPELNPNLFSLYQELKLITHRQEPKYITHRQDLQKTTNHYHHIPQNHIRLTKALWTYKNHSTLTLLLTSLTPQNPRTTVHGTIEVGQLHRQLIISVLDLIIGGLLKMHGKQ